MANDVVLFSSLDLGAPPVLNNAVGSLNALLYACLVTGYNTQTVTSVVVSGGVATATLSGHYVEVGKHIEVAGATSLTGINGRKKPLTRTSTTFTFDATGVADGTATGTITIKRSPLGWLREFNVSDVAIYKRSDVTATTSKLRLNDSHANGSTATWARVQAVETATGSGAAEYTGPCPMDSQVSGGLYWGKGSNTAAAKPWFLIGDSRSFYIWMDSDGFPATSYNGAHGSTGAFGDLISLRPSDAYRTFIAGSSDTSGNGGGITRCVNQLGTTPSGNCLFVQRAFSQFGGSVDMNSLSPHSSYIGGSGPVFPSPVDNGMVVNMRSYVVERNTTFNHPLRGRLPGVGQPLASFSSATQVPLMHRNTFANLDGFARSVIFLASQVSGTYALTAVDIEGPWD